MARAPFCLRDTQVGPGSWAVVNVPLPGLYTDTEVEMPVHVLHGRGDDPVGTDEREMLAPCDGIVIGRAHLPLAYEGEALFHIGRTGQHELLEQHIDALQDVEQLSLPELVEEPEIV